MVQERNAIPVEDKWDVEALYPTLQNWEEDMKKWGRESQHPHWPELLPFKGKLGEGAATIKALADISFNIERQLSKLFTYAHLRHDEDVADDTYKNAYVRITSLLHDFRHETSWIEPEILQIPEQKLSQFLESGELKEIKVHLEKIVRMKPHTLTAEKEELLALAGQPLETAHRSFSAFSNADLKFAPVQNSKGEILELTNGKYLLYMHDHDRKLREQAFKNIHNGYKSFENTLCELVNGQVQKHVFDMRSRKFKSCLEAALFPHQIETSVYTSLIEAVRGRLSSLHQYMRLRKKLLGYDDLHLYDLHVSLVPDVDMSMKYSEAVQRVMNSVGVLGKEYQTVLSNGLSKERWVDCYENARKRSGAYSSGCFDSRPYILMNYQGTFNDVMTLSHEAGHSMHTYLSCRNQPYQYSQYPIFVAEVASTFNEELLASDLMAQASSKEQKCFLINEKIDDIRGTLFRQTMFAEFELKLHQWAEQGIPLTPSMLKTEYRKLNEDYYGPDLVIDEESDIEWARVPHFYYNFYVYQYATGVSAALALVDKIKKEKEEARDRYLKFLSSGSSQYPLDLLKMAGVDMRKKDPVEAAIDHFDTLVNDLSHLMA